MDTANAIECRGLSKSYTGFTLKDLCLTLPEGSILGLIGENGAGKTTTLKAMLGLVHPDAGETFLLGQETRSPGFTQAKEEIGVVFDDVFFYPAYTPQRIGSILRRLYRRWEPEVYESLLRRFSLPERKPVSTFSRGMKMKLAFAAALSHHARLLILDEATSGLDPVMRDEILDLLREFVQEEDHSVLLSSHITSDLEKIADRIAYLQNGELVFSRNKDELLEECGVLRCGHEELQRLDRSRLIGLREGRFEAEALVLDRAGLQRQYPGLTIDPAKLEDIMVFYHREHHPESQKEGC